jgi:hypothetical protein
MCPVSELPRPPTEVFGSSEWLRIRSTPLRLVQRKETIDMVQPRLPIKPMPDLCLKEEWAKVEVGGKTWGLYTTIPDRSLLVQAPDGSWWILKSQDLGRYLVEEVEKLLKGDHRGY